MYCILDISPKGLNMVYTDILTHSQISCLEEHSSEGGKGLAGVYYNRSETQAKCQWLRAWHTGNQPQSKSSKQRLMSENEGSKVYNYSSKDKRN